VLGHKRAGVAFDLDLQGRIPDPEIMVELAGCVSEKRVAEALLNI